MQLPVEDELSSAILSYVFAATATGRKNAGSGPRRGVGNVADGEVAAVARRRPPRTHLTAEIIRRRNDPAKSDKSRTHAALDALGRGAVPEIEALIAEDTADVASEWQERYRNGAKDYWDQFYIEKNVNFFKDRNYLREEFTELMPEDVLRDPKQWVGPLAAASSTLELPFVAGDGVELRRRRLEGWTVLLEVGCAVGNGLFPMLRANDKLAGFACDVSPVAVRLLQEKAEYESGRCLAFPCDISIDDPLTEEHRKLSDVVPAGSVDFVSMLFVLSAIGPERHAGVLQRLRTALRPGGSVLFRDYGRYDLAQLRFAIGHRLGDSTYVRADGTLAVFFDASELRSLFEANGFDCLECEFRRREIVNRATAVVMPRVWVQGKFVKRPD